MKLNQHFKIKASPFLGDVISTTITSIITILSLVVITRLLAEGLGPDKFGAYSLVRRVIATIEPFSTTCMGIALTRYLAISKNEIARSNYFLGSIYLVIIPCLFIITPGICFREYLTVVLFHSREYQNLFSTMLFLIVGYSLYIILYSYYRGIGNMKRANLWQIAVMAVFPAFIVVFYAQSARVDLIILLFGVCFFSSIIPLIYLSGKSFKYTKSLLIKKDYIRSLLRYSLPRIPAQFAFGGILMIGPFMAPYFGGIKEAGYLVVSQSLLRVVEGGVEGFSRVALPKVAQIISNGRHDRLRERITDLIVFNFQIGLFITMHLLIWVQLLVLAWLGNQYLEVIPIMQVTILGLVPFIAFNMMRSIIDAVEVKAVNAGNLYKAFAVSLFFSIILAKAGLGAMGLIIAMLLGFWTLGFFTVRFLWVLYDVKLRDFFILRTVFLNLLFLGLALLVKYWLELRLNGLNLLISAFIIESILTFFYCYILWKSSVKWTIELVGRVINK